MGEENTGFPKPGSEATPPSEREPVSYEQAKAAAKALFDAKVKNPTTGEYKDPQVQAAWDKVNDWRRESNLHIRGVGTVEKARNIVRSANIWLEAGYKAPVAVRATLEILNDEYADALRGGDQEIIDIIGDAIGRTEQKLLPQEKAKVKLEKELAKAESAGEKNDLESLGEAVRRYAGILSFGPEYKKIFAENPAKREQIEGKLKNVRDTWHKMKFPNGPGK